MAAFIVMILFFYHVDPVLSNDASNKEFNLENLETPTIIRRNEDVLFSMKKNFNNKIDSILEKSGTQLNKNLGIEEIKSKINQVKTARSPKEKVDLIKNESQKIKEYLQSSSQMISATLNFLNLKVKEISEIDKIAQGSEAANDDKTRLELDSDILLRSLEKERKSVQKVLQKLKDQIHRLDNLPTESTNEAAPAHTPNSNAATIPESTATTEVTKSKREESASTNTSTGYCSKVKELITKYLKSYEDIENFSKLKSKLLDLTESQCKSASMKTPTSAAILVNRLTLLNWRKMLRKNGRKVKSRSKALKISKKSEVKPKSSSKVKIARKTKKEPKSRRATKDIIQEFD